MFIVNDITYLSSMCYVEKKNKKEMNNLYVALHIEER